MRDCQSKTGSENHIETQKKTHELDTRTGDNRHENTHNRSGDKPDWTLKEEQT